MVVQYFEPIMDEIENEKYIPFIGYINPRGQLVDYSILIGEQTHYSTKNPASMIFLQFISYIIKDFNPQKLKSFWDKEERIYKNNKTDGFNDVVKRGFDSFVNYNRCSYDDFLKQLNIYYESRKKHIKNYINLYYSYWDIPVYEQLQKDLILFFKNAYQNKNFFKAIGITPQVECLDKYLEIHKNEIKEKRKKYSWMSNYGDQDFYNDYQISQLMSYFKDIIVMYMGYDAIERRLKFKSNKLTKLKVITTSCTNPNERFYNWLLMDWHIQRIPKMFWNEHEKRFIQENPIINYYQTDKELILGEEITSIKKLIPKQYRNKYFRK